MKLYRAVELDKDGNTDIPVRAVCYHPLGEAKLRRGDTSINPDFCIVEYEYESVLAELCDALGWQGGTLVDAIKEVKRLKDSEPRSNQ
jgi:hypothetical protein